MSIPGKRTKIESIELELCPETLASIKDYCKWANISLEEFIEEISEYVFENDEEWKKHHHNHCLVQIDSATSQPA